MVVTPKCDNLIFLALSETKCLLASLTVTHISELTKEFYVCTSGTIEENLEDVGKSRHKKRCRDQNCVTTTGAFGQNVPTFGCHGDMSPTCRQLSQPIDGQASNAVRSGAGTCSRSTSSTSRNVVKDVKGTGDPRGIMDAVGRCQLAWRQPCQKRLLVLFDTPSDLRTAGSCSHQYKKGSYRICTCMWELANPFSLVPIQLAAKMEA